MQSTAGRIKTELDGYLAFHPVPLPPQSAFTLDEVGVLAGPADVTDRLHFEAQEAATCRFRALGRSFDIRALG